MGEDRDFHGRIGLLKDMTGKRTMSRASAKLTFMQCATGTADTALHFVDRRT
jgi:hypothetical protein